MGEGSRRFARPHRRVDPRVVEEAARDARHVGREAAIGVQHRVAGLVPAKRPRRHVGQRRIPVPVGERVAAEPSGLQLVVAVRQTRVGVLHGGDQRVDDLALDAVRQMARVRDIGEAAPAVGDLLVLGERVGDEREGSQVRPERLGQRAGGRLARSRVGVLHERQRRLERKLGLADVEAQAGDRLVEQPVPGAAPGHGFFVEQLFAAVVELERLLLADVLEPGPITGERPGGRCRIDQRILQPVQLQLEEQEVRRGVRHLLLGVAVEFGVCRIRRVPRIDEPGVRDDPAELVLERLVARDRRQEAPSSLRRGIRRREVGKTPFEVRRKLAAGVAGRRDVRGVSGGFGSGIEVRQVPLRQDAEPTVARQERGHGCGHAARDRGSEERHVRAVRGRLSFVHIGLPRGGSTAAGSAAPFRDVR